MPEVSFETPEAFSGARNFDSSGFSVGLSFAAFVFDSVFFSALLQATSTNWLKASRSCTARSARTLRSISTPAVRKPLMNMLYDIPRSRAAAFIRLIQSFLKSPFRARRSLYAYCRECITCSFAGLKDLLLEPRYPRAIFNTFFLRHLVATLCLVLGIVSNLQG